VSTTAIPRPGADPQQFSEQAEPFRRELQVHCYRILGSLHEAEDMVQETMLRAWKRLETFQGRAAFRSWLYKIATNACLDFIDSKRSRRLLPFNKVPAADPHAQFTPPSPELTWLEPFPDEWLGDESALNPEARYTASEAISLAFITVLQTLPSRQRAVLILRDVLDFSANETAEILELTVSSVNSALHRARVTLSNRYQKHPPEDSALPLIDEKTQHLLDHFVRAWQTADVAGLVALLKEDARFAMPPSPSWYEGPAAIGTFTTGTVFAERQLRAGLRHLPTHSAKSISSFWDHPIGYRRKQARAIGQLYRSNPASPLWSAIHSALTIKQIALQLTGNDCDGWLP
jgi:RNA polymerase sigma-70 factor (ECF subfamily)